ncbi:MAG: 50S ribosomal protein L5 [Chloroflexota bacterium]|nr:50S ribosomal protein L5 [Chloroflexota bacterium]MDE2683779.1 50S ribosomal protein L5 [Chloroflexota bacterium]
MTTEQQTEAAQEQEGRGRRQRRRQEEAESGSNGATELPPPSFKIRYREEIIPAMVSEFEYSSPMQVPRLQKVNLNIGLGEALTNGRAMESAVRDLTTISGQKPIITRARRSIAGFKVRQGNPIGTAVTLRGDRMYYFLERLIITALPRIRDFRGISRRGFDGRGNFSLGLREQIVFPEIDYNSVDRLRGLQVTITTTADNDAEATRLLEHFGMPFIRQ